VPSRREFFKKLGLASVGAAACVTVDKLAPQQDDAIKIRSPYAVTWKDGKITEHYKPLPMKPVYWDKDLIKDVNWMYHWPSKHTVTATEIQHRQRVMNDNGRALMEEHSRSMAKAMARKLDEEIMKEVRHA
jgi:hypothetical protein